MMLHYEPCEGFLEYGYLLNHPLFDGIFPYKPSIFWGTPHLWNIMAGQGRAALCQHLQDGQWPGPLCRCLGHGVRDADFTLGKTNI